MTHDGAAAVRVTVDEDVVWATIDRPRTRNAINLDVVARLEAMVAVADERRAKVVVLRGADGTFCSGADLREVRRMIDDRDGLRAFMSRLGAVLERLEDAPWVTVAVVEGYAVAGGCELLLASDIVVAATDARIGDRHVEYGLAPAAGGSVRLAGAVSSTMARYLLLTGEMLSGVDAADRGLATVAVPPTNLDREVERIVARLRSRGRATLRTVKAMLADDAKAGRRTRLVRELELFLDHATTSLDVRAGLDAFVNGAAPEFDGGGDGAAAASRSSG